MDISKELFKEIRDRNLFYYECNLVEGNLYDLCSVWEELRTGIE